MDFESYHRLHLPELLASGRGQMARAALPGCGPLALRVSGGPSFTYFGGDRGLEIEPGDHRASSLVELDEATWSDLLAELEAPAGLIYSRRARCLRGDLVDLMAWETALRAAYNGRPPYSAELARLKNRNDQALDPESTFRFDEDREIQREFFEAAGYLFVRSVFSAVEAREMLAQSAQLAGEARKGDKLSWWGKNDAGEEILCRVTRARSKPAFTGLPDDARLLALRDLHDPSFVHKRGEGDGVTVIFKNPGMKEGLGDLPWHRDCGMGGHALNCPTLVVSIYLSESSPATGDLAMLPGSHRAAFNAHDPNLAAIVALAARFHAQPGDVSLHLSDTVHGAPPPARLGLANYRTSAILGYGRPDAHHHRGESSYNAVLHQRDDGQVEHLVDHAKKS